MKAIYHGETDKGKIRVNNEDRCLLQKINERYILAAAIDGVGGHYGGEIAADIAHRCILEHVTASAGNGNNNEVLQAAVIYANNSINSQRINPLTNKMGCVLTAALIDLEQGRLDISHIGDSRLYILKEGILKQITKDHSRIAPLIESGKITEEEAMKHPQRNLVTRIAGEEILHWGTEYIQTHSFPLQPCTVLLCSDGLCDMIPPEHTRQILCAPGTVKERTGKLIEAALEAGGKDNVTVIVIEIME